MNPDVQLTANTAHLQLNEQMQNDSRSASEGLTQLRCAQKSDNVHCPVGKNGLCQDEYGLI